MTEKGRVVVFAGAVSAPKPSATCTGRYPANPGFSQFDISKSFKKDFRRLTTEEGASTHYGKEPPGLLRTRQNGADACKSSIVQRADRYSPNLDCLSCLC